MPSYRILVRRTEIAFGTKVFPFMTILSVMYKMAFITELSVTFSAGKSNTFMYIPYVPSNVGFLSSTKTTMWA